jgi:two-component system, chemotaxis family, protein-glutamate methylesterase/glutaminase
MASGIVVVGASWGGLQALTTLVGGFPKDFPLPLVLIQHRSRDSTSALAELLQDASKLCVCEVEDKAPVVPGHVHIAPADYHLLIDGGFFALSTEAPHRYSRPSIDITFESAAFAYGKGTIGVVLTGANADGSDGLRRIMSLGGTAIVQDPATAESPTMPKAAIEAVPTAAVLPIDGIAAHLVKLVAKRSAKQQQLGRAV